ncbi:MAG: DNA-directed RNA polymerase subunit beta, partial [Dehalococcoidia bacterium]
NQHPIVKKGDKVKEGQVLVDSFSLDGGNLALGRNVVCAFMSWEGCNYEDAIVISRSLVKNDAFTSVHIEKHEIEERDTKLGPEEITRDIPNVNEESLANLDEIGIVHAGAEVKPNDILVGKITPKGETEPSAEEKLLRAIFGEKTREVKDSSLRMPSGEWGRVIRIKVFSRDKQDELPAGVNNLIQVWVAQKRKISVGDKMSGRHGNKGVISTILPEEDMPFLPDGTPVDIVLNPLGVPSRMNVGQVLEAHLGWAAQTLGFKVVNPIFDGADALTIEDALARTWIAWKAGAVNFSTEDHGSAKTDLEKVDEWLSGHGFDAKEIMDEEQKGVARRVSLCLWLEELGVTDSQQIRTLSDEDLEQLVQKVYKERKLYPPIFGKMELRDGRTGEPFNKPVTVGNVYIMKLIHLVGDKVHARSTGPYSLITQQPLGGKAQFGGQRFGEMEVWALEGYGAAHTLQEMLTIKSDDVMGRAKAYESLVKGEDIQQLGIPESTKVLFMELRSLGFAVELLSEGKNVSI